jgi:hypothetical protein
LKPVGKISQRMFVPQIKVSEPKIEMVDSQIQTNYQEIDREFDDHSTSRDEKVQTDFGKVAAEKKKGREDGKEVIRVTPR